MQITKKQFYVLSFTWGIVMTLVGLVTALFLIITGHRPTKHGWCYCFEVGKNWGGVNLGPIIITSTCPSEHTKNHEHGHALQNCIWGPLMLFAIAIPSAVRYNIRKLQSRRGKILKPYDSVWYESDATRRGHNFINYLGGEQFGNN